MANPSRTAAPGWRTVGWLMLAGVAVLVPRTAAADDAALRSQGEYLSRAADCLSCHSEPGAPPFSGGAPLQTPFGGVVAPNITPDPQTGIGTWSASDFARALRQGVRRDGLPLYPAMPYDSYTKLSDADVNALWAFIRALPPVRRAARPNTLRFPMNVRPGVAVWQAAYFQPGRLAPVAGKSAQWNRGAYLVEALGHCGDCHTPRNFAMAADAHRRLAGARVERWYAPDIGSDALARLTGRSVDELAAYLKTGRGPGNIVAAGPMREVIEQSLSHLTDADLRAMAVYLADQPVNANPPGAASPPLDPRQLSAGKAVYDEQCAGCHQAAGTGARRVVPALAGDPGVTAREPVNVITAVLEGFDPQGDWGAMPSYAAVLDDDQIAAVANYVRNSWGNHGERAATAWSVAALRAVAQTPPGGTRAALQCPLLAFDVMQPAMRPGTQALAASARDPALLARLVRAYQAARPAASGAEVIEALSAAYCRVLTAGPSSSATQTARAIARANAALPEYSRQVARVLFPVAVP